MFPLRELVLIDCARDFRHISWTKQYLGAAFGSVRISFLQRSCSSICGSRSFRQAGIVWSQICCVGLLLSCLSELMSFKCDVYLRGKSASSNFKAFAFCVSSSGAGPGSLSVKKMSCTSCLAQYKSKAYFCASFVIPLASRKLS